MQLWPWLNEVLTAVGAPIVTRSISYRTAYFVGALLEMIYHLAGLSREPRMTRFLAAQLAKSHYFDISAARRDFGYNPKVSTAEGLRRLTASLKMVQGWQGRSVPSLR